MSGAIEMTRQPTEYNGPERRAVDARIVRLEGRLDGHEDVCAVRYKSLEEKITESKDAVAGLYAIVWKVAGAIITLLITGFVGLWQQINAAKHLIN